MEETILELKDITKLYPGVKALDHVNLSFKKGEIHALVGENGAGKSTLIKTITGAIWPTDGEVIVNGKSFKALTPALSRENGIAAVYQEFALVPVLDVTENIFMGEYIRKGLFFDKKEMRNRAKKLLDSLNIEINPDEKVENLTTGYQQIVEIAKAISKNAQILIMDEPSAPLTNNEVDAMFRIVRQVKQQGMTVIYISHRLEEIFQLADRVSVLRDGTYICTKNIQDTDKDDLIKLMVGRTLKESYPPRNYAADEIILEVKNLTGNGVKDISFQLRKGEILGFGGLVGAGRTELAELLFGSAKIKSGEIYMHGNRLSPGSPKDSISSGISLVPEDRKHQGLVLDMTVRDNLCMASMKDLSAKGMLNKRQAERFAKEYVEALKIKTPGIMQKVKNLSGGNQQKVVLGKWMGRQPEILIFDEPTRGIDVGAKQEIYKLMTALVEEGKSIIMISSEMEELLGMSDRIVVFSKGRLTKTLEKKDFSQEAVLKYSAEVVKDGE